MRVVTVNRPGLADVKGDTEWSTLEQALLAACPNGWPACLPNRDDLPQDDSDPDRRVRAGLIRYLMLGGSDEEGGVLPSPQGVRLIGGWIAGVLDLEGCETQLDLKLWRCRISERAVLQDARIGALYLPGCAAPQGLDLHRLETRRGVHLNYGFVAGGMVDLAGARIGGELDCDGGSFKGKPMALDCDNARIGASVFLRDGFHAAGMLNFVRAEIAGNLRVQDAILDAGLDMEAARVGHGFFWQNVTGARERLDLTEAHVGSLRDEWQSWAGCKTLILDGFRYDRLDGAMTVAQRLAWLGKADTARAAKTDAALAPAFEPQPYLQLANVLRAQGNRDGAAEIMVHREWRQRQAERRWLWMQNNSPVGMRRWLFGTLLYPFSWLFGLVAGYGHRPARLLVVAAVLVIMAAVLAGAAYDAGQFAPNSPVILTSTAWQAALAAHAAGGDMPLLIWLEGPTAADYEQFDRWLYGLDLFLPLDALGQEAAWRPTTGRGGWGDLAFYSRWFFQGMGWIVTALAAAVLTGLVGRRD
ncbi:hypothetical protein LSUCC0031_03475 [Rhodobacterales bacterium LSUCC0031]|nr:hypothetical protein [Rhodobacterales bacterium LSUCC0031]